MVVQPLFVQEQRFQIQTGLSSLLTEMGSRFEEAVTFNRTKLLSGLKSHLPEWVERHPVGEPLAEVGLLSGDLVTHLVAVVQLVLAKPKNEQNDIESRLGTSI